MQKYVINWKMRVMFYSSIDFFIDLLKKENNVIKSYFVLFVLKNI